VSFRSNTWVVAKDYAVGLVGGLVLALVVAVVYVATEPKQEEGLLWGSQVYTTKQEFKGYLKSKGLSYRIWLARNPGAAPWEPSVERSAAAERSSSRSPVFPAALGMVLGFVCALLVFRRRAREAIAARIAGLVSPSSAGFGETAHVDVEAGDARVPRGVGTGTVAFGVIATLTSGMFLLFVAVLAAA